MPTERAGYTVTMFLVDISPSMGMTRVLDLPRGPKGEERTKETTNLEWSLQFVKLKIQEMIFNGRKTDQCGVIVFGSEETNNIINEKNGGYDHVSAYIPIGQPNAGTLAKLDALRPSKEVVADPVDALIVGIETQDQYLANKKTWTRKMVLVTDGENPIETEDWEATVNKMNSLKITMTIVGIDFDDEELPFKEENKSDTKTENESFYKQLTSALESGLMGTCDLALRDLGHPDIKQVKSALTGTTIRLGDVAVRPEEAIEIMVKTSKCTALTRPKGWKKFTHRTSSDEDIQMDGGEDADAIFAQLKIRTEYFIDHGREDEGEENDQVMSEAGEGKEDNLEKVEKEQLIRGFKYGSTYAPCPDGQFPKLETKKGMDICGFFDAKNFRRELAMGEVQYVWADPSSALHQVALSSMVKAMHDKDVFAIARWIGKDGSDPKMGVLAPIAIDEIDYLLWVQMPFADDVRKYNFASLDHIMSKRGERITHHPYIPTAEQLSAMEKLVDGMDLMAAGVDEEGKQAPWFDTRLSYNPAVHRTKQALFHSAIVSDVASDPIPEPHPELLKYFEPPREVVERARDAVEECQKVFKIKEVPKKVARARKDGHVHARDEDEGTLLLDVKMPKRTAAQAASQILDSTQEWLSHAKPSKAPTEGSDTEEEEEPELLLAQKPPSSSKGYPLPTPARSLSPDIDPGRAPGRIIGTTYPLDDFKKNIAQGDLVSKAVEDLGFVIKEIAMKPFSSRRHHELIESMKLLREVASKEDEIDAWNYFLKDLKEACLSYPGNKEFWDQIQQLGREISFISDKEASMLGGVSTIPESAAIEFIQS